VIKTPLALAGLVLAASLSLSGWLSDSRKAPSLNHTPDSATAARTESVGPFALDVQEESRAPQSGSTDRAAPPKTNMGAVGDALERIACPEGYAAFVFANDLSAPDGLAFDASGRLLVVEETTGEITRIDKHGKHKTVAEGLHSPEGLFTTPDGLLFCAEDGPDGRLLSIDKRGKLTALAEHLDAPEGVLLLGERLFVTESTAQLAKNKFATRTRLTEVRRTKRGWGKSQLVFERGLPLSFSELVADDEGRLLIANELAGGFIRGGLMAYDLDTGELTTFTTGLISPEGLAWSRDGSWPLFVAEEDIDGKGAGRISTVDKDGKRTTFATGFGTLEDVLVAADGRIFVSEDINRQGIALRPVE
jgi:sugar lactone lactonase YvrE